jgi:metal-responsive CopG/Arc/MetJ family transcriptional regulator
MLGTFQVSAPMEWLQKVDEAARILGISRSALIRLATDQYIEAMKKGDPTRC